MKRCPKCGDLVAAYWQEDSIGLVCTRCGEERSLAQCSRDLAADLVAAVRRARTDAGARRVIARRLHTCLIELLSL